jgi:hypothetical protein
VCCWCGCKLLPRPRLPSALSRTWATALIAVAGWLAARQNQFPIRNLRQQSQHKPTGRIKFHYLHRRWSSGICRKVRLIQFLPLPCRRCWRWPRRFTRGIVPCFSDSFSQTPVVCLEPVCFGSLCFFSTEFLCP